MSDDTSKNNDILKKVFRQLHRDIANQLNALSVIDKLYEESIIGTSDMSELDLIDDRIKKCRKLLLLLQNSPNPSAFIHMRMAMKCETADKWLVDEIDKQYDLLMEKGREASTSFSKQALTGTKLLIKRTESLNIYFNFDSTITSGAGAPWYGGQFLS